MGKIACLFPGQGSQSVGMGRDFHDTYPKARKLFADIDRIATNSLSHLCFQGPADELKRTVNTQPTILAASMVAWHCYKEAGGPDPEFVAGHSLGELTALYAAGVLSAAPTIALVEKRAHLMEACPPGAMSAVLGVKFEDLRDLCAQVSAETGNVVIVANFNTREQLVISGVPAAVQVASERAKALGAKVIPLPVGGAFHSPLMKEASLEFNHLIDQSPFLDARFPVVQNFSAEAATKADKLKENLRMQMSNSVRWCETIEYMLSQGVDQFIEIGPGKALSGMVKRIQRDAKVYNVEDKTSLEATLSALGNPVSV